MVKVYLYPAEAVLPDQFPVPPPPGEDFFAQLSSILNKAVDVCLLHLDGGQAEFLLNHELSPPANYEVVAPSEQSPDVSDPQWRYILNRQASTIFSDVLRETRAIQSSRDTERRALLESDPRLDSTMLDAATMRADAREDATSDE